MELSHFEFVATFATGDPPVQAQVMVAYHPGEPPDPVQVRCDIRWPLATRPGLARILKAAGFELTSHGENRAELWLDNNTEPAAAEDTARSLLARAHPKSVTPTSWVYAQEDAEDFEQLTLTERPEGEHLYLDITCNDPFRNEESVTAFMNALRGEHEWWRGDSVAFDAAGKRISLRLTAGGGATLAATMKTISSLYVANPPAR
jgi:hypothetical protein